MEQASRFQARAVVFDMDGVLVDSAPSHRRAFEEIFAPLGIHDFVYAEHAGQRTPEVVNAVLRRAGLEPDAALVAALSASKTRLAQDHFRAENPIMPGCLGVLRKLAGVYPLALASSGSRSSVELFFELNQCRGLFGSVLSGGDVSLAKPDPEIYLRSFAALGVHPEKAVVVEDAVSGILAAKAAGAGLVVGVAGTCAEENLISAGAHCVIKSLGQLPDLLNPDT